MVEVRLPWWPTLSSVACWMRWFASMVCSLGNSASPSRSAEAGAVVDAEDEGVVAVGWGGGVGVGGLGGEDVDACAAEG